MNSIYYLNQVSKIEKEIGDLYKKVADESKKENDKIRQIDSINRSVTKNTSFSTLQSKQRQIQSYQNDIQGYRKKIADYQKQIGVKSSELARKKQEARKAEESETKKLQKDQQDFQKQLQEDIARQKLQLDLLTNHNHEAQSRLSNTEDLTKEFDFFISHASEDKNEFVRDLADALKENGFEVWYDEFELKLGDSLRKKIDNGLSKSKYGIVIISPDFIRKNWTEYELNGMVAREMNGRKVILPIWHKVSKDEVLKFSPTLADKIALNTSIHTIEEIVKALGDLL